MMKNAIKLVVLLFMVINTTTTWALSFGPHIYCPQIVSCSQSACLHHGTLDFPFSSLNVAYTYFPSDRKMDIQLNQVSAHTNDLDYYPNKQEEVDCIYGNNIKGKIVTLIAFPSAGLYADNSAGSFNTPTDNGHTICGSIGTVINAQRCPLQRRTR